MLMTFISTSSPDFRVAIETLVASLLPQPSNKGSLQNQNEKDWLHIYQEIKNVWFAQVITYW